MRLTWILTGHLAASGMIGPSDLPDLETLGISAILSLTLRSPFPGEVPHGVSHLHLPVPDMSCPSPEQLDRAVDFLLGARDGRRRALVHCGAGYGRTGTVIACYLVARGAAPEEAIRFVRAARPGSIETAEQERGIADFAERVNGGNHE